MEGEIRFFSVCDVVLCFLLLIPRTLRWRRKGVEWRKEKKGWRRRSLSQKLLERRRSSHTKRNSEGKVFSKPGQLFLWRQVCVRRSVCEVNVWVGGCITIYY